jgi:iron complex transport system substrate-binding protein
VEADRLQGLDPDVLLVEPCGYDLEQTRADAHEHRELLERLAPRAVAARQAWLLHSSFYSRSGPRTIDGVEALAAILHPGAHPAAPEPTVAVRW